MENGKKSPRRMLYCIPLILQLILHILASSGLPKYATDINDALWRIIASVIITVFSVLAGEGYGAIAFVVAGFYDRIVTYVVVIIFSAIGVIVNFVGYTLAGIEGNQVLWMTVGFWCIDLFLIIFSIIRITQLASKKNG